MPQTTILKELWRKEFPIISFDFIKVHNLINFSLIQCYD